MIRIVSSASRRVQLSEILAMSKKTALEENLSFRKVRDLAKNCSDGNVLLAEEKGRIIGWIEKYHLWGDWWGLSSLYVEPNYREQGVGRKMLLPAAVHSLERKNIYAATTNPIMWEVLLQQGLSQTKLFSYPLPVLVRLVQLRYTNWRSLLKLWKLSQKNIQYYWRKAV